MGCPKVTRATKAVSKGPTAKVISTLATVVKVKATMKAVNMVAQHKPEIQRTGPAERIFLNTPRPCNKGKITSKATTVNRLRQKVTSKLRADSNWRVTTPAIDHMAALATINPTAWV
jgi:hypothetical protein